MDECYRLIAESSGKLTPAMFWSNGSRVYDHEVREAFNCKLRNDEISDISCDVVERFSGERVERARIESPEIVCYPPGNGMERHLDGPHRSYSLVFFLNRGYQGGELIFEDHSTFKDVPVGSVVVWENNSEAWHSSNPIIKGFKWVLVTWVRRPGEFKPEKEVHAQIKAKAYHYNAN